MAMADSNTFTAMKVMINCMELLAPTMSSCGEDQETIPSSEENRWWRDRS